MKKIYLFSIISFLCALLMGCYEDKYFFESEDKYALYGELNPDDDFEIFINKSFHFTDTTQFVSIPDATIEIYENDRSIGILSHHDDWLKNSYSLNNLKPQAGNTYTVIVQFSDKVQLSAECAVPEPVPIFSVDTSMQILPGVQNRYDEAKLDAQITFIDPANSTNYYVIYVTEKLLSNSLSEEGDILLMDTIDYPVHFFSVDPIIDGKKGDELVTAYFSDKLIDGKEYTFSMSFITNWFGFDHGKVCITLYSISESLYKMNKNKIQQDKAFDDIYSESVPLYSNVKNGLGVLAAYSTSKYILEIK